MSRVVRISDDAFEIAASYGSTLSEAIRMMDTLIRELRRTERTQLDPKEIERMVRSAVRDEIETVMYRG